MLILDIRTLSFLGLVSSVVLALGLQLVNRLVQNDPAIRSWTRGVALYGVGFVGIALRGTIPDAISIIAANGLVMAGYGQLYLGCRRFFGLPIGMRWDIFPAVIAMMLGTYFTYWDPSLGARITVFSTLLACLAFATSHVMLRIGAQRAGIERLMSLLVGIAFLTVAVALLLRAIGTPFSPLGNDLTQLTGVLQTHIFMVGIILNLVLGIALPMMVSSRIQARLADSERRLQDAQAIARMGSYEIDIEAGTWAGTESIDRLFGLDPRRTRTTAGWMGLVHPDDRPGMQAHFEDFLAGRVPVFDWEYRLRRPVDGTVTWVQGLGRFDEDPAGGPRRMIGTLQDINERKMREGTARRLREASEAKYRIAKILQEAPRPLAERLIEALERIATLPDLGLVAPPRILLPDPATGAIDASEPFCARAFQSREILTDADEPGRWAVPLVYGPDCLGILCLEAEAAPDDREIRETLEQVGTLLALAIANDRAERATNEARDAADAASRAKSEFLATMSHEIRTPMNGVVGMAHLLLGTPLTDRQRAYADTIVGSAQSLLTIINDILDFSKIEASKLELETIAFRPGGLAREVTDVLRPEAKAKGLSLACEVEDGVPESVIGDPIRVRQILTNLVSNAIKFTERGGVTLRVARADQADPNRLAFLVADTGIGMSQDVVDRLFSPFVQADVSTTRRYGGTGLGLSICRRLAELMEGSISVTSAPRQGSTFRVALPFAPDESGPPAPVPIVAARARLPKDARILLVEDNAVNRLVILEMLTTLGLAATTAENGSEAVEMLGAGRYNLVLMDCQMPVMDGFEATGWIRRGEAGTDNIGVRIVALTANAMMGDRERCLAAGMDDYLPKPVIFADLAASLAKWLASAAPPAPAETAPPEVAVFDEKRLLNALADSRDFARKVVAMSLQDLPRLLHSTESAAADGVWSEARRFVHSMKSVAAQVGGTRLANKLASLEEHMRAGGIADQAALVEMRRDTEALGRALEAWYAS